MKTKSREVPSSPQDVCPLLAGMAVPELVLTSAGGSSFDLMKAVTETFLRPTSDFDGGRWHGGTPIGVGPRK